MSKDIKSVAKTSETTFEVVDALRDLDGGTIEEISEYLGFAESTVHRHLATLRKHEYAVRDGEEYHVALGFLTVGEHARRRTTAYPMIKEKVDTLATETGERAQFIVEEHGQRVYLYTNVGESAVQTGATTGKRGELYTSAAGKAILADLDDDRVDEILEERGLTTSGPNAVSSRAELDEELARIRDRGYAFNRQETTEGVHAVGAAVTDANDEVVGALSVAGPANRVKGERFTDTLPERILGATNELELHIAHSVQG
ncbi:IclR family transcriptional regulator [Haloparvum sp. AD34]